MTEQCNLVCLESQNTLLKKKSSSRVRSKTNIVPFVWIGCGVLALSYSGYHLMAGENTSTSRVVVKHTESRSTTTGDMESAKTAVVTGEMSSVETEVAEEPKSGNCEVNPTGVAALTAVCCATTWVACFGLESLFCECTSNRVPEEEEEVEKEARATAEAKRVADEKEAQVAAEAAEQLSTTQQKAAVKIQTSIRRRLAARRFSEAREEAQRRKENDEKRIAEERKAAEEEQQLRIAEEEKRIAEEAAVEKEKPMQTVEAEEEPEVAEFNDEDWKNMVYSLPEDLWFQKNRHLLEAAEKNKLTANSAVSSDSSPSLALSNGVWEKPRSEEKADETFEALWKHYA